MVKKLVLFKTLTSFKFLHYVPEQLDVRGFWKVNSVSPTDHEMMIDFYQRWRCAVFVKSVRSCFILQKIYTFTGNFYVNVVVKIATKRHLIVIATPFEVRWDTDKVAMVPLLFLSLLTLIRYIIHYTMYLTCWLIFWTVMTFCQVTTSLLCPTLPL